MSYKASGRNYCGNAYRAWNNKKRERLGKAGMCVRNVG